MNLAMLNRVSTPSSKPAPSPPPKKDPPKQEAPKQNLAQLNKVDPPPKKDPPKQEAPKQNLAQLNIVDPPKQTSNQISGSLASTSIDKNGFSASVGKVDGSASSIKVSGGVSGASFNYTGESVSGSVKLLEARAELGGIKIGDLTMPTSVQALAAVNTYSGSVSANILGAKITLTGDVYLGAVGIEAGVKSNYNKNGSPTGATGKLGAAVGPAGAGFSIDVQF